MSQQNKKMQLLGNAPIPQALLAMGIPTMIGMLVNALYNLVDAYFVGGLGESQMGAIFSCVPIRTGCGWFRVAIWKWGSILHFQIVRTQ
mgnify:CR=1 FL=1